MSEVIIRPYQPGDEAQVVDLYNVCFSAQRTLAEWQRRYEQNPAGQAAITVAHESGELVGHSAFIPGHYQVQERISIGGLYADFMVRADHRGGPPSERLSARLLKAVYTQVQAQGYDFLYGTPNVRSRGLAQHSSGSDQVSKVPQLSKLLNPAYLMGSTVGVRLRRAGRRLAVSLAFQSHSHHIRQTDTIDARFDKLWQTACSDYRVIGVRNAAYLRWRYQSVPTVKVGAGAQMYHIYVKESYARLDGYVVVRVQEQGHWRFGYLVDLLARSGDVPTIRELVRAGVQHCRAAGVDVIRCWMLDTYLAHQVLCEMGFRPRAQDLFWRVNTLTTVGNPNPLLDRESWYFTLGDSDGV